MVEKRAYGRVGLLGNPSDIYGGKCISFTFDKSAEVGVDKSDELRIVGNGGIEERTLEYNGRHDLVKASIRYIGLENRKILVKYDSSVPLGAGLAGSSAIVVAALRAFNEFFNFGFDNYQIAEKALKVESEELGITAGFQDRYAISFEGVSYMDFCGKEFMRESDDYGIIERLDVRKIPFFLSLGVKPKNSAAVHNPLREKFLMGGSEAERIKQGMGEIANLAFEGREYLLEKDWTNFGRLMDENTELREEICPHFPMDLEMIRRAKEFGALGAKVAGSGGSVIVLSENKEVFDNMSEEYPVYRPRIVGGD